MQLAYTHLACNIIPRFFCIYIQMQKMSALYTLISVYVYNTIMFLIRKKIVDVFDTEKKYE